MINNAVDPNTGSRATEYTTITPPINREGYGYYFVQLEILRDQIREENPKVSGR